MTLTASSHRSGDPDDPTLWQPPFAATLARETHVSDLHRGQQTQDPDQLSVTPTASGARSRRKSRPSRVPGESTGGPIVNPALGRQRLDDLQQQGQAGPPVRAVLHDTHDFEFGDQSASAPSCSTTRSSASSPRCIPTTPGRRSSSIRGSRTTWDVNDTVLIARSEDR